MAEGLKNFGVLLEDLHANATLADSTTTGNYVEINEKRQFVPNEFDTVIAYEGDINSQIITFKSIRKFDNHDLFACQNHEIRWKNLTSGVEGTSKLSVTGETDTSFYAAWEIPAELCTQAGTIEISIAYYDRSKLDTDTDIHTGPVVYSWNTASYNGLSIGKSMDSVGFQFPAKNEILVINKETRAILAPSGYNNTVCNYGDIGVSTLYFLVDRYIGQKNSKIDVFEDAKISIYVIYNGERKSFCSDSINPDNGLSLIEKKLYTKEISDRNKEGMVFIAWPIPKEITCNEESYSGRFEIAIEFFVTENDVKKQAWYSNNYKLLEIGPSIDTVPLDDGGTVVPRDFIYSVIEQFFNEYDITIVNNKQ